MSACDILVKSGVEHMANASKWRTALSGGSFDERMKTLYGSRFDGQRQRYIAAVDAFVDRFGDRDGIVVFSVPGRTEIGGNHTDHNHGRALTGAVNLDVLAVAAPCDEPNIVIHSRGHRENCVALGNLEPVAAERRSSNALVRGIASRMVQLGHNVGGLVAYTTSDVTSGFGMSSSAAFEILVGTMLTRFYNPTAAIGGVTLAQIGQYAENVYYGKPSGLLDQLGSVCGGLVAVDLADEQHPVITPVNCDFDASGHALCLVKAGGSHANLTAEFSAIPAEMKAVANALGHTSLRQADASALFANMAALREQTGDRALLRAMHYYKENDRVDGQVRALQSGDWAGFLALVTASGRSSFMYNQNVLRSTDPRCQELALALAMSQHLLGDEGASRVHGGGFSGTVQAFVPHGRLAAYKTGMEALLGDNRCLVLSIRSQGPVIWEV